MNSKHPMISVIIPVYNVQEYLTECVESVLNQEYKDFELILVDDGSTDNSGVYCDEFAKKDARVKVVHQQNSGLSEARNKGLEIALGDFITFIDSDDFIHQQMLRQLYLNLVEAEADVSVCGFQYVKSNKQPFDRKLSNRTNVISGREAAGMIINLSDRGMIIACSKLYRRTLFQNLKYPKGKLHEDEFVTYQLFDQAGIVVISEAKLYYYRLRKDSITGSRYSLKRLDKLEALRLCIDYYIEKKDKKMIIAAKYRYLLNLQIAYFRIYTGLKQETETLIRLKEEHQRQYKELIDNKDRNGRISDEITVRIFHYNPFLYLLLAKLYLKICH